MTDYCEILDKPYPHGINANVYQKLAARTINQRLTRQDKEYHAAFGLASEAGEVASIYQHQFQGQPLEIGRVVDELGDVLWMAAELCTALDITLDMVMRHNIQKLIKRYPDGFTEIRSLNRHKDSDDLISED